MAHALLPLKDLVAAKTRLSGILSASERRGLMQAMAQDVLAVLSNHPGLSAVTLVSDDPGASLLAANYAIEHLPEQELAAEGLNAVLAAACERISPQAETQILVLHADLPFLQGHEIQLALERQQQSGGLVIGTDCEQRGTNLLLFAANERPLFHFGVDSCAKHQDWARQAGLPAQVLQTSGVARDVDQPRDVLMLLQASLDPNSALGASTRAFLSEPKLAARLHIALADLDDEQGSPQATFSEDYCGHDK